ncbi:MAG: ATP-binding protein [Candidatus Micrarchaeota archaeon]
MQLNYILSKELAGKMILVHPPEPRKELLLSPPGDGIYLGKTRFLGTPVFWDFRKLINPHISIVGITGSGKSYLVKSFLTRASLLWDSNAIILDWVGEYVKWVKQAGGTVINLGMEKLNLLDLAGLTKSERIKQIVSALDVLLDLKSYPHERDDIEEALEEVYDSARKGSSPTLADVAERLLKTKKKSAARLVKRFTVEGSDFFSGKSSIDLKKITHSGLVCIDLHSLPTEEIRSLAGLTILQYIKEIMRREGIREEKGVKLFVVLDEAWKIANDERSDVITIVREGRKYNFALIVASQNPTDLHKTIFSNVGTMFVMRLVLKEFRDYVRQSVGYSDFIDNEISRFGVGDAALNMIFAQRQGKSSTFLLNKIDGEEPLFLLKIKGGEMEVEVEREQLMKMFYELGLTEQQMGIVKMEFEKGDGLLDAEKIVALLEKFGYSKSSIIAFLRQLGIDEKNIIQIFSLVKMRTAGKGVVNITMDD